MREFATESHFRRPLPRHNQVEEYAWVFRVCQVAVPIRVCLPNYFQPSSLQGFTSVSGASMKWGWWV